MLIVPADSRFTRGRLALVTWALVVVNVLVFVVVSGHDDRVMAQALDYYSQTRLATYEFPLYLQALRRRGQERTAEQLQQGLAGLQPAQQAVLQSQVMLHDVAFQDALDRDRLITPERPEYTEWKSERRGLQPILRQNWSAQAALRPDAPRWWAFFSYQFLHGGWGHVLGNMLMLVLVGRLVEGMVGAGRYLLVYLATGVAAGAAFIAVHPGSETPLVGASGAIAGIMGLFTAVFAQRRVRFFYAFFGFVGFAAWPALWLLPYWIGWELLQLALANGSRVAYEGHVGGLIAGALAARLLRNLPGDEATQARLDAPEQEQRFEQDLQEAARLVGGLHVERARALLEQLHQQRPSDARPLRHLFALARLAPESSAYREMVVRVLEAPAAHPDMRALVQEVRDDYLRSARPAAGMPPGLLIDLLEHAAQRGDQAAADRLLKPLLTTAGGERRVHQALLKLAQSTTADKARAYRALAARHFS